MLLWKINTQGKTQCQSSLGGPYRDEGNHAIQTSYGGYVAVGYNQMTPISDSTIRQVYIVKVNSQGQYQWIRGNSPSMYAEGYRIRQTFDNGFAIVGNAYGTALTRTDSNGYLQWRKHFPCF